MFLPPSWRELKTTWDSLWVSATSLNESERYRSVSSGGAKHTRQRSSPQKMQSWLHFQSNLLETETVLEISLSCQESTPVSAVEVTAYSVFFIDAAKKGHLSPDSRTHWHCAFCLHHSDLDNLVLDAPCASICLSFPSTNPEAGLHRPGPQLSLAWSGLTATACLSAGFFSNWPASSGKRSNWQLAYSQGMCILQSLAWFQFFFFFLRVKFRIAHPFEDLREIIYT